MYCENCGHKLPEDALFCPNCGHNLKRHSFFKVIQFFRSIWDATYNFDKHYARWSDGKRILFLISVMVSILIVSGAVTFGAMMWYDNKYVDNQDDSLDDITTDYSISQPSTSPESSQSIDDSDSNDYSLSQDNSYSDATSDSSSSDSSENYGSSGSGYYVGSKNSNKFHYPSCHYADNIKSYNLISFSSRDDALSSGYSPCKSCSP